MTKTPEVHIIDHNFLNCPNAIASYLIPAKEGLVLIESGPGSTIETLKNTIHNLGYKVEEITNVLLTHIHLDHAGAAGWLASHGAMIHVHERGYPHLLDPSKLISSAARLYQDKMEYLWGKILPVPEDLLVSVTDGAEIQIGELVFRALDTPGHANHHLVYLLDQICFSGDVGGVRIQSAGKKHLRIPMPPPEFHPTKWRESIERLKKESINTIAPTHFGFFNDVEWHLDEVLSELDTSEQWMAEIMPQDLGIEDLRSEFITWVRERSIKQGIQEITLDAFEKANPSGMSADGMKRYWDKYVKIE